MALHPLRLRRALTLSSSLLHRSLQSPKPISFGLLSTPRLTPSPTPTLFPVQFTTRFFTSTTTLLRKAFDPETDEIGPDTILFEGCDYNHWLITMDFPKDSNLTRDQMIDTYVNTAAQVFGSVEEAKKKLYALSTTTYQGFQVECSEETSEKFKSLPGVVFVLPDSYIDPVNKEYGGDKYVNGEIFPRPAPVHYGRRGGNWDRRPREQNYGPPGHPPQQNYGPPGPPPQQNYGQRPQQNYGPPGPPPQQNYGPRPQQNYGPRPQQNYGPPPQQNYGPRPQQNYRPPSSLQQNSGPPPQLQQNYEQPLQQNYSPPEQVYAPRPNPSYGQPPQSFGQKMQQSYGNSPNYPPQQNYSPAASREGNIVSSYQGNFNQPEPPRNYGAPPPKYEQPLGQNYSPPQQGYVPPPHQSFGQPPPQSFGQNTQQSYGNSPNFPPQQSYSPAGSGNENKMSSYQGTLNQPEPRNHYVQGQGNFQNHMASEQRVFFKMLISDLHRVEVLNECQVDREIFHLFKIINQEWSSVLAAMWLLSFDSGL